MRRLIFSITLRTNEFLRCVSLSSLGETVEGSVFWHVNIVANNKRSQDKIYRLEKFGWSGVATDRDALCPARRTFREKQK